MTPDRRKHRGPHPRDRELFAERHHDLLRQAVSEFSWLLTRDYAARATLKLVGDRYALTARQRLAVLRCGCHDPARERSVVTATDLDLCAGQDLAIDGYNLLITLESALSGGLVLLGRDGRYRDLASVHGNYRPVEETDPAIELLLESALGLRPSRVDLYLDRPVSNSARLKNRIAELLEQYNPDCTIPFNIELAASPDRLLMNYDGVVVTTDSAVLRRCVKVLDLAGSIIREQIPQAWILDLRDPALRDAGDDGTQW
jgi:hypothetical protein